MSGGERQRVEWTTLESGDINASLMALKDCFRAHAANRAAAAAAASAAGVDEKRNRAGTAGTASAGVGQLRPARPAAAAGGRMPFRAHRLTQVLKGCFTDPTHRTVLLAMASPSPTDLIHTRNTLDHVTLTAPDLDRPDRRRCVVASLAVQAAAPEVPVAQWTPAQVAAFVATTDAGKFADLVLPAGLDGKGLLSLTSARLANLFEGTLGTRGAWVIGSGEQEGSLGPAGGEEGGGVGGAAEGEQGSSHSASGYGSVSAVPADGEGENVEERVGGQMGTVEDSSQDDGGGSGGDISGVDDALPGSGETSAAAAAAAAVAAAAERTAREEEALRRRRRRRTIGEDLFLAVRRESQRISQAETARWGLCVQLICEKKISKRSQFVLNALHV